MGNIKFKFLVCVNYTSLRNLVLEAILFTSFQSYKLTVDWTVDWTLN